MNIFTTSNKINFSCSKKAHCCVSWDIFLSKEIIRKIQQEKNSFPVLKEHPDFFTIVNEDNPIYYATVKLKNNKCLFLNEDNSCSIFNVFGKNNGNPLCLHFPFMKLKLKDRYVIMTSLACLSQIESLFDEHNIKLITTTDDDNKSWPVIPFNHMETVHFSKDIYFSWDAYYLMEKFFLDKTLNPDISIWQLMFSLGIFHNQIIKSNISCFSSDTIKKVLNELQFDDFTASDSIEEILFFIKRKINMYNFPPFIELVKDMLNLAENNIFSDNRVDFQQELSKWDLQFKKAFAIKFFSNPSNFLMSIQFFLHVIVFYFGFIKLFLFPYWIKNKTLKKGDISLAFQNVEQYFLHDTSIFKFWGQGKRGSKDFNQESLFKLMI